MRRKDFCCLYSVSSKEVDDSKSMETVAKINCAELVLSLQISGVEHPYDLPLAKLYQKEISYSPDELDE